jgi:hypothetical protein
MMKEGSAMSDWQDEEEEEKKSLEPLEIDEGTHEIHTDTSLPIYAPKRRRRPEPPRWKVVLRYLALSSLAVSLTLVCPGETKLWTIHKNSEHILDRERLTEVILIYIVTLTAFFVIQGRYVIISCHTHSVGFLHAWITGYLLS